MSAWDERLADELRKAAGREDARERRGRVRPRLPVGLRPTLAGLAVAAAAILAVLLILPSDDVEPPAGPAAAGTYVAAKGASAELKLGGTTYRLRARDGRQYAGALERTGNRLTLGASAMCLRDTNTRSARARREAAEYQVVGRGSTFRLELGRDRCLGRASTLTAVTWRRISRDG